MRFLLVFASPVFSIKYYHSACGAHRHSLTRTLISIAKDRSWFGSDYVPFKSEVATAFGESMRVEGIGTVELPTKLPFSPESNGHAILRLTNVLHVPGAIYNILGFPLVQEYEVETSFRNPSEGSIQDQRGRSLACFKWASPEVHLLTVQLSEPPVGPELGPSVFREPGLYMIQVAWPVAERQRWSAYQARVNANASLNIDVISGRGHNSTATGQQAGDSEPLYTAQERRWLREHFGGEYKFLRMYHRSIYKDEDREEGRSIARALMQEYKAEAEAQAEAAT